MILFIILTNPFSKSFEVIRLFYTLKFKLSRFLSYVVLLITSSRSSDKARTFKLSSYLSLVNFDTILVRLILNSFDPVSSLLIFSISIFIRLIFVRISEWFLLRFSKTLKIFCNSTVMLFAS